MDPEDKPPVPLTAFLQKGLRMPSCNDGVAFVVVSLKDQVSCFFFAGRKLFMAFLVEILST